MDDVTGLPTPFELTGDPRWNEGGDLYRQYGLALDRRPIIENSAVSESVEEPELSDDEPIEELEESKKAFSFGFWCLRKHATMALAIVRKWLTVNFGIDHHRR